MFRVPKIVRQYMDAHELTAPALARRVGTSRQNIENLLKRDTPYKLIPDWLPSLARVMGYQKVEELLSGNRPPNSGTHLGVAHELSPLPFDHPDPLSWEEVKMHRDKPLPRTFVLVVPDDALAARTPRGTKLVFDTEAKPEPGDGVLVADRSGTPYLRRYAQGRDGNWIAEADGSYLTLESERDGLELLACAVWIDRVKV